MNPSQASLRRAFREACRTQQDPDLADLLGFLGLEPLIVPDELQTPSKIHWCAQDDPWLALVSPAVSKLRRLQPTLNKAPGNRFALGRHVEQLARWVVDHLLDAQLIAHNLPIFDTLGENPRRTIGELDLVYRLSSSPQVRHRELAAKWYIYDPELPVPSPTNQAWASPWWGPMRRDRLDLKLSRMIEHQVALGQHPATRAELGEQRPELHELWLCGQLFWPLGQPAPSSQEAHALRINARAISGAWARHENWCKDPQLHPPGARWYVLDKSAWLRMRHGPTQAQLCTREIDTPWPRPRMLALRPTSETQEFWTESMRMFVVPNSWGHHS